MKKGFTLIELLVVIAIIGILASVVLAALDSFRCKKDPTHEGCEGAKTEETTKSNSAIADKFDRSKTVPVSDMVYNNIDDAQYNSEPTMQQECGNIPDSENKVACETEYKRSQNLRDCVERYGINDSN